MKNKYRRNNSPVATDSTVHNAMLYLSENKRIVALFGLLLAATLFKYLIGGFCYYPVLDDYIQYGGYPLYGDIGYVLFDIGTIATRPLASVLDVVFWGRLWAVPGVALFIITLLHFTSGVLFYKTLLRLDAPVSPLFPIIFLLLPLGAEATYWLSASTRLVVGLFFVSLSTYMLTGYIKSGRLQFFLLFALFSLISGGFYEPVAVFGFCAGMIILITRRKTHRMTAAYLVLVISLLSVFLYSVLAADIGRMGSRASGLAINGIFLRTAKLLAHLFTAMAGGGFNTTVRGFASGLAVLFGKGFLGILYIVAVGIICLLIGKISLSFIPERPSKMRTRITVLCGILLFFAPFAPNLLTDSGWITFRSLFTSFLGLALIADALLTLLGKKAVSFIAISALSFIFVISGVNEYDTYRRVNALDNALLYKVVSELPEDVLSGGRKAAVLLEYVPEVPQVSYYNDHVKSVFYTDWALTGAVRSYLGNMKIKEVTPVFPDMTFDFSEYFVIDLRDTQH